MAVVLPMWMSICWKIIVDQLGREVAHLKKPHPPRLWRHKTHPRNIFVTTKVKWLYKSELS